MSSTVDPIDLTPLINTLNVKQGCAGWLATKLMGVKPAEMAALLSDLWQQLSLSRSMEADARLELVRERLAHRDKLNQVRRETEERERSIRGRIASAILAYGKAYGYSPAPPPAYAILISPYQFRELMDDHDLRAGSLGSMRQPYKGLVVYTGRHIHGPLILSRDALDAMLKSGVELDLRCKTRP